MISIRSAGLARSLAVAMAVLFALACCLVAGPVVPASAATAITVNGTSAGRTFDGIGAISGGGGNSRLLTDYPAAEQTQILDYLFKPGYGADLQILKVEIGGDTNSTDGSESSIEHASGSINCSAGYNWWLMEQAKALNPAIKLYGLAWGAPGWIGGGNFWSTDMINYLVSWLNCAKSHGLAINYLGGWNERGYNIAWYEQLRSTLNADGYSAVQIVGADSDWSIATDIANNSTFASAVNIIGVHYPCQGGDGGSADRQVEIFRRLGLAGAGIAGPLLWSGAGSFTSHPGGGGSPGPEPGMGRRRRPCRGRCRSTAGPRPGGGRRRRLSGDPGLTPGQLCLSRRGPGL